MEMLIGGTWPPAASGQTEDVTSPFDGAVAGTVPVADADDVRIALDRAEAGAAAWRRTPAHERMRILLRAAELADERAGLTAVAAGGYIDAGQACISVQRVITHPAVEADFLGALVPKAEAIRTGNPRSHQTTMGTLITAAEAERVQGSIRRAVDGGAKLLTGGERDGAVLAPARRSPR
jgi:acyl-CoA reductase-like NAD-dependent aldehyde dehydrogenase